MTRNTLISGEVEDVFGVLEERTCAPDSARELVTRHGAGYVRTQNGEGEAKASPSFRYLGYPRNLLAAETSTTIAAIGIATFTRRNFFPERATISTEIGEGFRVRIAYPP